MGDNSGNSDMSFTKDNEYLMEGVDGKPKEEDNVGGWKTVMQRNRQLGGQKSRLQGQGGGRQRLGDGDGANEAWRQRSGNGDGSDMARSLPMAPPMEPP